MSKKFIFAVIMTVVAGGIAMIDSWQSHKQSEQLDNLEDRVKCLESQNNEKES